MKTHLHHSCPFQSFAAPMYTARSPPPLPHDRAPAEPQLLFDVVSFPTRGRRRERKRRLGASEDARFAAAAKGIGSGAGVSVYAKLSPPPREGSGAMQTPDACTNDVTLHRRRRRTTPQRSVPPARGEGEGNLARTRKRAHQSVSVKSLHRFTLYLQSTWNQHVAKQKW